MRTLTRIFRFPTAFVALAAAAFLVTAAAAAAPLFRSATGSALLQEFITQNEQDPPAVEVQTTHFAAPDLADYRDRLLTSTIAGYTGDFTRTIIGDLTTLFSGERGETSLMITRTNALDHVDVVEQATDGDVWVSDYTADRLKASAGDELVVTANGEDIPVKIAGVFRDLLNDPRDKYWDPLLPLIESDPSANVRQPPFLIVDDQTFFEFSTTFENDRVEYRWEFPLLDKTMTIDQGRLLSADLDNAAQDFRDPTAQVGAAFLSSTYSSSVQGWLGQAEESVDAISPPIASLTLAALITAMIAVVVSAFFLVRRRRTEFDLLHARGTSPLLVGARSVVEVLIPVALGAAAGWYGTLVAIERWGPPGQLGDAGRSDSLVYGSVAAVLTLLLIGVVCGNAVRRRETTASLRLRKAAAAFPWELIVVILAGVALFELRSTEAAVTEEGVPQIGRFVLAFPILLVLGGAAIAARGLRALAGRARVQPAAKRTWLYLAYRRFAHASRLSSRLVTTIAVAIGILSFGVMTSSSIRKGAFEEAFLRVGSDVAVTVGDGELPDLPFEATLVEKVIGTEITPSETEVDLLAIDSETFEGAAYWDGAFSDQPLDELLGELGSSGDGVRAIVAGEGVGSEDITLDAPGLPVEVVGRASAFPGMGGRPLLVVDAAAYTAALEAASQAVPFADTREVWARGDVDEVVHALEEIGLSPASPVSAAELRENPSFLAIRSMLSFMQAVGIAAAFIAVLALLLFLQLRQRDAQLSYALMGRMGLSRGTHRRSIASEVFLTALAGSVVGLVLGVIGSQLIDDRLTAARTPSGIPLPLWLIAGLFVGLVFVALSGGWFVQREADRANVAEVLRSVD